MAKISIKDVVEKARIAAAAYAVGTSIKLSNGFSLRNALAAVDGIGRDEAEGGWDEDAACFVVCAHGNEGVEE